MGNCKNSCKWYKVGTVRRLSQKFTRTEVAARRESFSPFVRFTNTYSARSLFLVRDIAHLFVRRKRFPRTIAIASLYSSVRARLPKSSAATRAARRVWSARNIECPEVCVAFDTHVTSRRVSARSLRSCIARAKMRLQCVLFRRCNCWELKSDALSLSLSRASRVLCRG